MLTKSVERTRFARVFGLFFFLRLFTLNHNHELFNPTKGVLNTRMGGIMRRVAVQEWGGRGRVANHQILPEVDADAQNKCPTGKRQPFACRRDEKIRRS